MTTPLKMIHKWWMEEIFCDSVVSSSMKWNLNENSYLDSGPPKWKKTENNFVSRQGFNRNSFKFNSDKRKQGKLWKYLYIEITDNFSSGWEIFVVFTDRQKSFLSVTKNIFIEKLLITIYLISLCEHEFPFKRPFKDQAVKQTIIENWNYLLPFWISLQSSSFLKRKRQCSFRH